MMANFGQEERCSGQRNGKRNLNVFINQNCISILILDSYFRKEVRGE